MQSTYLSSRFCLYCKARETPEGAATRILRCGRCKSALYCSVECQAKHWQWHRSFCALTADTKDVLGSRIGVEAKEATLFADVQPFIESVQTDICICMHSILKAFTNRTLTSSHFVFLRFLPANAETSSDPRQLFQLVSGELVLRSEMIEFLKREHVGEAEELALDASPAALDEKMGPPSWPTGRERVPLVCKFSAHKDVCCPKYSVVVPTDLHPLLKRGAPVGDDEEHWVAALKGVLAGSPLAWSKDGYLSLGSLYQRAARR
ncbi:hypothetical protein BCR35DRAFT_332529 [Leucosporidium creatinivorum]|uniref:MYND-type domain-containing protein n=1 Tax=Leucosporidium creatinivorum TaxID=106004 RepID=A0A1Y2F3S7_9BASI|nr:hypothetical protein BCR35DRAFT_332529 [Leucosporidium creatinivorum]